MPAPSLLETPRLIGERLCDRHLDVLCAMHRDPVLMATLAGVRSDDWTFAFLQRQIASWEERGFGLWLFRDRANGRVVGRGGLHPALVEGRDEVALAYALWPTHWRQGLATEMARAVVGVAFDAVELPDLTCFTLTTNRASEAVMRKVGFRHVGPVTYADLPHIFFRLRREEYLAGRIPPTDGGT